MIAIRLQPRNVLVDHFLQMTQLGLSYLLGQIRGELFHSRAHTEQIALERVTRTDAVSCLLVFFSVSFRVRDHFVYLGLVQSAFLVLYFYILALACAFFARVHAQYTVGVYVKSYLYSWYSSWRFLINLTIVKFKLK